MIKRILKDSVLAMDLSTITDPSALYLQHFLSVRTDIFLFSSGFVRQFLGHNFKKTLQLTLTAK
jgi:hypothetical protein